MKIEKTPVFGTSEPLPLKGFPEGKYRIRIRQNCLAKVYVKTKDGIEEFIPCIKDGYWIPGYKVAQNIRQNTK